MWYATQRHLHRHRFIVLCGCLAMCLDVCLAWNNFIASSSFFTAWLRETYRTLHLFISICTCMYLCVRVNRVALIFSLQYVLFCSVHTSVACKCRLQPKTQQTPKQTTWVFYALIMAHPSSSSYTHYLSRELMYDLLLFVFFFLHFRVCIFLFGLLFFCLLFSLFLVLLLYPFSFCCRILLLNWIELNWNERSENREFITHVNSQLNSSQTE